MNANKTLAENTAPSHNGGMSAKPVRDGRQMIELESQLEAMIARHGYRKTLVAIEIGWVEKRCTWDAYQQLLAVARNVNNRLEVK